MSTSRISFRLLQYTVYGHDGGEDCSSVLRFNGNRKDPVTGHYLLGNGYRAFNSVLMRFNAPDSLSPFDEGGLNAYCYCSNDPVNNVDPSGHFGFFLNGGLFTTRWGLRSAASYVLGPKAPRLKTLGVKKALSEVDPALPARVKHAEKNQSWGQSDVKRLENAWVWLQGRAYRFEFAEKYFAAEGFPLEAQAAHETRKEILVIKQWVEKQFVKANDVFKKRLFDTLPFSEPTEQIPKVRNGG
ncbi:RHS repeat-associated core domain-containing protein [Pseudomonas putida]|uniref:RHS repeat-associated core domain-containing protein n=2 Tax=Bacteria TaxID=2 RepID=UPI0009BFA02B